MLAHARLFRTAGFPVTIIAGQGSPESLPPGTSFIEIPLMDSQHPDIVGVNKLLQSGKVPEQFNEMANDLMKELSRVLAGFDIVIVHNVFTKHFNLPLTASLFRWLDTGSMPGRHARPACIAWCHDFSWTSAHSLPSLYPGYPWDLLRQFRQDIKYVTISKTRQEELANLLDCPADIIRVIYNGVDLPVLLGLTEEGQTLGKRLGIFEDELVMLMPVRITQAKNIEFGIRVIAALKQNKIKSSLVITGPPDPHDENNLAYLESLKELCRQLQVEQQVHFVYECGPDTSSPYVIDMTLVGDLYRLSDILFMPSHREGFGMPILEAGLAGLPIFSTAIPAAVEVGQPDLTLFSADDPPERVAGTIVEWMDRSSTYQLRRRIRLKHTWQAIFANDLLPLIAESSGSGEHPDDA